MEEKFNSDQWWNKNKCRCECKKRQVCEKDYILNPQYLRQFLGTSFSAATLPIYYNVE